MADAGPAGPSLMRLPDRPLSIAMQYCTPKERTALGATCRELHAIESHDDMWESTARKAFPDLGSYLTSARASAPSGSRWGSWKGVFGHFSAVETRWRRLSPGKDLAHASWPVSVGHPLFGCSLFSPARPDVAASSFLSRDCYIVAGADATLALVNSAQEALPLPLPGATEQADGILGFGYDPRSRLAVTGSFGGKVQFMRINVEAVDTLATQRAGALRDLLQEQGLRTSDCLEKSDLVRRVVSSNALPLAWQCGRGSERHAGTAVGVSVEGSLVATAANDGFVKLWHVPADAGWTNTAEPSAGRRLLRRTVTDIDPMRSTSLSDAPCDSLCMRTEGGHATVGGRGSRGAIAVGNKAGRAAVFDLETNTRIFDATVTHFDPTVGMPAWVWCVSLGGTLHKYGDAMADGPPRLVPDSPSPGAASGAPAAGFSSQGHAGSTQGVLYAAGTDGMLTAWDLRASADQGPVAAFHTSSADGVSAPIAGLDVREAAGTLVAGLFSGSLLVCDLRAGRIRPVEPAHAHSRQPGTPGSSSSSSGGGGGGGGRYGGGGAQQAPSPHDWAQGQPASPASSSAAAAAAVAAASSPLPQATSPPPTASGTLSVGMGLRAKFSSETERFTRVAIGPASFAGACFDGKCYVWDMGGP
ncbi:hypothetical protein FNF27_00660 [Cafeteria roenbergensis]|uniref:F-box domain-containing protein n=2 Tax=Cafeteria roenbergensis TaxID=33653 RepID=A0A5A8EKT6_CAFRO|nr:hypothetical protein FNF27_00660 [Cafeteria roenbergensis]